MQRAEQPWSLTAIVNSEAAGKAPEAASPFPSGPARPWTEAALRERCFRFRIGMLTVCCAQFLRETLFFAVRFNSCEAVV